MVTNKPRQLEIKRKEHYDKLYQRQPQLLRRLIPLLEKAGIIQSSTEPPLYEPKLSRRKLIKKLNKFSHSKRPKESRIKKVSKVRPDVLWNLR